MSDAEAEGTTVAGTAGEVEREDETEVEKDVEKEVEGATEEGDVHGAAEGAAEGATEGAAEGAAEGAPKSEGVLPRRQHPRRQHPRPLHPRPLHPRSLTHLSGNDAFLPAIHCFFLLLPRGHLRSLPRCCRLCLLLYPLLRCILYSTRQGSSSRRDHAKTEK